MNKNIDKSRLAICVPSVAFTQPSSVQRKLLTKQNKQQTNIYEGKTIIHRLEDGGENIHSL